MQGVLLYVSKWELTDEKTGALVKGATAWALIDSADEGKDAKGIKPAKFQVEQSEADRLLASELPCVAEFSIGTRIGANNSARAVIRVGQVGRKLSLFGASAPTAAPKAA